MERTEDVEDLQQRLEAAEALSDELAIALESRIVIEQAKGILAERLGVSINDAFELLRYAARTARTRIHDLAGRLVYEDGTPNAIVVAIARQSRWRAAFMRERIEAERERMDELTGAVRAQMEKLAAQHSSEAVVRPIRPRRPPELGADRSVEAGNQSSLYRAVNEAIEGRREGEGPSWASDREFICECTRRNCTSRIRLTIEEYEHVRQFPTHFIVDSGHVDTDLEKVVSVTESYVIVEKLGAGASRARELDPRHPGALRHAPGRD